MLVNSSHYLEVYDTNLIYSWTPREYKNFVKGAQHREIDRYEQMAKGAMMNRYANNAKSVKEKKMFDADKARKRLNSDSKEWKDSRDSVMDLTRYKKAREALNDYKPTFKSKGGKRK